MTAAISLICRNCGHEALQHIIGLKPMQDFRDPRCWECPPPALSDELSFNGPTTFEPKP